MACTCKKQQAGKGYGNVVGYITIEECAECKAVREANNAAQKIKDAEAKVIKDREDLIDAKMHSMAEEEFKKEGKL